MGQRESSFLFASIDPLIFDINIFSYYGGSYFATVAVSVPAEDL
jgi:hypothetical protein